MAVLNLKELQPNKVSKDISSYSENTYLQKTLKMYLLDKKEPGIGLGCLTLCK